MGNKVKFYSDIMSLNNAVTGSCKPVIVKIPGQQPRTIRFAVDCGSFQEIEYDMYNDDFPFNAENLDFVLITHNHVDHIGRLPLLVKKGFNNTIYTTEGTRRLLALSLPDCHKIVKEKCKKLKSSPPYSLTDVGNALALVKGCKYDEEICVHPNVYVTFLTNGHLVGSSLIYVRIVCQGYDDINLLFTGDYRGYNEFIDVKPIPQRILEKPVTIIQESTYGTMESKEMQPCFKQNILECIERGWTIVVPVFSLGRSQEILYKLKLMQENGELDKKIPIFLDGKLAIRYTNLYVKKANNILGIKEDMRDFLPENLTFVDRTTRSSVLYSDNCKIILTTSGMGSYGPAQLYISHYIQKKNTLIHFTGYTARGTLGERIKSASYGDSVEVAGMIVTKRAKVEYTTEWSAHAKADEMIDFLKQFKNIKLVLVDHGEPEVKLAFADRIYEEVKPKDVEILNRNYFFRVSPYGLTKILSTKF